MKHTNIVEYVKYGSRQRKLYYLGQTQHDQILDFYLLLSNTPLPIFLKLPAY